MSERSCDFHGGGMYADDDEKKRPAVMVLETNGMCGADWYSVCASCAIEHLGRTGEKWHHWSEVTILNSDGQEQTFKDATDEDIEFVVRLMTALEEGHADAEPIAE